MSYIPSCSYTSTLDTLNNIGKIYAAQRNYTKALQYYEEALKIDTQLGDQSGITIRLNNIASIHYEQGEYDEALEKFQHGLKIAEQLQQKSGQATQNWWIGLIYSRLGKKTKAISHLTQAMSLYRELGLQEKVERINAQIKNLKN